MLLWALAVAGQIAADCQAFAQPSAGPLMVAIAPLTMSDLDPDAPPVLAGASARLGAFLVQDGERFRSADPRFTAVARAAARGGLIACGNEFILPSRFDPAAGRFLTRGEVGLQATPEAGSPGTGATEAARLGAVPVLAGYQPISTWPTYGSRRWLFFGLMAAEAGPPRTVVVAFPARSGRVPAVQLAAMRGRYTALSVVPLLHASGSILSLAGWQPDGTLQRFGLQLSGEAEADLLARLGQPMR